MAEFNINVPMLPESVMSGVIAAINKHIGDSVEIGDVIAELETDKVMLEIPANHSGIVKECYVEVGQEVTQDQPIIAISTDASSQKTQEKHVQPATVEVSDHSKSSPSARVAAEKLSVDLESISGSGRNGTIMKSDVLSSSQSSSNNFAEIVPMSRMRATIAKRLVASKNQTAMLTTFNDVNMDAVIALRQQHKEAFLEKHCAKLGFTSFFIKAITQAIKDFPIINASIDGESVIYHKVCHIGVAVSTDKGLVVPVIRDADQLGMGDIEVKVSELAEKARSQHLTIDELQGGTFTLTNGGVFGSLLSTPIINPPQSAILGMHRIEKRVVVDKDDKMQISSMMYLALSYDHRLIDGRDSVGFLCKVKEYLENPSRIMLQV